jgi:GntR family transcriptional regulator / MocR family aminotransferase
MLGTSRQPRKSQNGLVLGPESKHALPSAITLIGSARNFKEQVFMRSRQEVSDIWTKLFPQFANSSSTLQGQVKEMIVHSILEELIPGDAKVPPGRSLSQALGVSRNTVALAFQGLVDKGFLISRPRSGLFVNRDMLLGRASSQQAAKKADENIDWHARFAVNPGLQRNIQKPANWQDYRYPFVYGQFDASLMPLTDWRACSQQALLAPAVKKWSQDFIDRDADVLVDQIMNRLLPARGIMARRDEILITAGAQMACYLLTKLLIDRETVVGIEEPGYPDARNTFALHSKKLRYLPVDGEGLMASRGLGGCAYAYVTPSHQCPTTVTMPLHRRLELLELARKRDIVFFEDDHESELNFSGRPLPALKSLDTEGRVIYLGSLSKTLAHGLRIGYVVAPAELVRELRSLRRLVTRHPPTNNAHIAGLFIAYGHHEAFIRKLNVTYRERRACLEAAFKKYLPHFQIMPSLGGSGAWIQGPPNLNSTDLAQRCAVRGVLIEPGDIFFGKSSPLCASFFRMGYSAISVDLVEAGVMELREAVNESGCGHL